VARLRALLVVLALAGVAGSYRTAEDDEASALAKQRVEEECADVDFSDVDEEAGRQALESGAGEDNLVLEMMKASKKPGDLGREFRNIVGPGWAIRTAGPMVFSLILGVVWFICCWTACPFCRCCRCGQRQRKTPLWLKFLLLAAIVVLVISMVICAMLAFRGKGHIEGGLNSISCTASQVLDSTLNGNEEESFIGILPLLDEFGELRSQLDDGSAFVREVQDVVSDTEEVERALFVTTESLELLAETLGLDENKKRPGIEDKMDDLIEAVQLLSTAVSDGVAIALANAREEVDVQLSSENRAALRDIFDDAITPLREAATSVRTSMNFFIRDGFGDVKDTALNIAGAAIISIAIVIFLVGACGCSAGLLCTFMERHDTKGGGNPWNRHIAPCACTTWCFGWLYAFLVFFFGGFMIVCLVPLSSTCLVMDDLNTELLKEILPSLGVDFDESGEDTFGMIADVIDGCFAKKGASGKSLTDIIYFMEGGVKVTLTEKIKGQTTEPIEEQFANLRTKLKGDNATLADQPVVGDLKQALLKFEEELAAAPFQLGFRCDLFKLPPLGLTCDVKAMYKSGGTWQNDCLQDDPLRMERQSIDCTSADFAAYVGDWATRLDKVLARMDDAVAETTNEIVDTLQTSVDTKILQPVERIVDRAECTFLKNAYADMVTGLCYQGVVGFSFVARAYVANGVLTLMLILIAYIVWRVSLDNRNTWGSEVTPLEG